MSTVPQNSPAAVAAIADAVADAKRMLIELRSLPKRNCFSRVLLTPPFDAANLLFMDLRADNLKPGEPTVGDLCFLSLHIRGFLSVTVPDLIQEPPPKREPYTPDDSTPPSPYIPLAHR